MFTFIAQLSRTNPDPVQSNEALWFIFGMAVLVMVYIGYRIFDKIQKERSKAILIFVDHSTNTMYPFGNYQGIVPFKITVMGGKSKSFWALQTHAPQQGDFFIIPPYGSPDDMIMTSEDVPFLVLMFGRIIGTGAHGKEVHREWAEKAFPKGAYRFEEPGEIPSNYILVVPFWDQGMAKTVFTNTVEGMNAVFALMHSMRCDQAAYIDLLNEKYGSLLSVQMKTTIEHGLSQWTSVVDAWHNLFKERTVPIRVLANLLHIASNKVTLAGIGHTLSQGSLQSAASFARSLKDTTDDLLNSMDQVAMDKPIAEMTFERANQNMEQVRTLQQQNERLQGELQGLLSQIQSNRPSANNQQASSETIAMRENNRN